MSALEYHYCWGSVAMYLRCGGFFHQHLIFQMYCWVCEWKNCENWSLLDVVMKLINSNAANKICTASTTGAQWGGMSEYSVQENYKQIRMANEQKMAWKSKKINILNACRCSTSQTWKCGFQKFRAPWS